MFESTSRMWAGVFVALGIASGGLFIGNGIKSYVDSHRYVTVKGLSEREVRANIISWPIVTKSVGNDLSLLSRDMELQTQTIKKFLLQNGLSEEEISISPTEIIDMEAERYRTDKPNYRYNTTSAIMVVSNKVELVQSLLTRQRDLIEQGVTLAGGDYRYEVRYEYSLLNDIKTEMINEATAQARATAEEFAKNSKSSLGKIRQANQGQITITDRDVNTPYIKVVRVVTTVTYSLKH